MSTTTATISMADTFRTTTTKPNYRPLLHFMPLTGFMNDPNGLIFYEGEYHLFYQTNPYEMRAGHVHWGHAVSTDLLRWKELPLAIPESDAGEAFSGSMVWDRHNSCGLFKKESGGLVAVYTRASRINQAQEIGYSEDYGRTFQLYDKNPVLDLTSNSFRDPKVFWHEPTKRWVMAAAHAREHDVGFYGSADLKQWKLLSKFGKAGWVGTDYECPDLVEVPIEGEKGEGGASRWVLFVSIGPGAPLGGSAVQYFVGDFDGTHFTPENRATRMIDFGPDFYAVQSFSGVSGDPIVKAWASNWLYCNSTPADTARGMMTLARRLKLRQTEQKGWVVVQSFIPLDCIAGKPWVDRSYPPKAGTIERVPLPENTAAELKLKVRADEETVFLVRFVNDHGEVLEVAFDSVVNASVVVNRGGSRGFKNRLFMDRAIAALPMNTRELDMHIVFDRSLIELICLNGQLAATFLHYFAESPTHIELAAEGKGQVMVQQALIRPLNPKISEHPAQLVE